MFTIIEMEKKCYSIFSVAVWLLTAGFFGCTNTGSSQQSTDEAPYRKEEFKNYWYSGTAEINSYQLQQSRYGETREGKAVLIFVTEDFSLKKQVKLDDPEKSSNDKVSVLKLNFTKNFVTGIYPYSMMLSVFTPVERNPFPNTLKTTMTGQEWCGHIFTQLNLVNKKYRIQSNSYFEKEGDQQSQLSLALLEDELWNLIRLDPDNLPMGEVKIIPGLFFTRLLHKELATLQATTSKKQGGDETIYEISIPASKRILSIRYANKFPHQILGWEENFEERGKAVVTKAILDKTLRTDYWTKNKNQSVGLRDSLGLSHNNY